MIIINIFKVFQDSLELLPMLKWVDFTHKILHLCGWDMLDLNLEVMILYFSNSFLIYTQKLMCLGVMEQSIETLYFQATTNLFTFKIKTKSEFNFTVTPAFLLMISILEDKFQTFKPLLSFSKWNIKIHFLITWFYWPEELRDKVDTCRSFFKRKKMVEI